jgi:hypothetical protein
VLAGLPSDAEIDIGAARNRGASDRDGPDATIGPQEACDAAV